jgi:two-component system, LytTR family, sensor kinase
MSSTWYKKKWVIVLLHAAVWTVLFLFPVLLEKSIHDTKPEPVSNRSWYTYLSIFSDALWISFFYLNAYLLIPKLAYRKRIFSYVLILLSIFGFLMLFHWAFGAFIIHQPSFNPRILFNIFPFVFILACSTAYRTIQDRMEAENLSKERVTENLKTELSFLRSQVNPHFMFNVLNNMVSLARKKSDLLEPSLIKLSSLLRYMLYETDEEKVQLEKEVEYIHSYIDLQLQRFGKKLVVNVNMNTIDKPYEIEPMLLIAFVENAFKHGTGMILNPQIDIDLQARNGVLQFTVKNRYNNETAEEKDKTSGIGLTNVKRRLKLLYDGQHTLLITKADGWFITSLQLNLH